MTSLLLATAAVASAPNTEIALKAPFAYGFWDRFGIAGASYHHAPWGGDWAVDFYGNAGDQVQFRAKERVPAATYGDVYGVIESNASSCASPYDQAGTAYKIDVYDGDGYHLGWVLYAHVDTSAVGLRAVGSVVVHGDVLGTIEQFPWSSCYQVSTPTGVHTHVEVYNDSDYACYTPWAAGTQLLLRNNLGRLGTTFPAPRTACF